MKLSCISSISLLMLCGCVNPERIPYEYNNTNKLDKQLAKEDVCLIVDNETTTLKKGHKNLLISPFLGQGGYNPSDVQKNLVTYNSEYAYKSCKNPIKLKRKIEVSSISYPDTCYNLQYAGSVYTGATSTINPWGTVNTTINSIPHYNVNSYACMTTQYHTAINFYYDNTFVGSMKSPLWNKYSDIDDTISFFSKNFIDKVQKDYSNKRREQYCANCYNSCETTWCEFKCALKQCDNIQNKK